MPLPTDRIVLSIDKAHASVVYTNEHSAATGRNMPKLYVQVIDAYRYQRELSVQLRWEPGNSKNLFWEYHIYRHPGYRYIGTISEAVATRFIERFLEQSQQYPTLLFNEASDRQARCEGFVHLAEKLHDGYELSVKLLG